MIAADQVLDCVPDGAVLLILRELMHDDLTLVITLVTSESTTVVNQPLEQVADLMKVDPALAPLNNLALNTLALRLSIEKGPWPELVAQPAGTILEGWRRWLGPAEGILADLRAKGYRRLFVVPDGPLHVFPLHLIGPIGQPLCADWLVSTLPTPLTLAAGACGRTAPRRAGVSAFGIDFADFPFPGFKELKDAVAEAVAIAAAVPGGRAATNAQATRRAVAEALRTRQWVHLATHGTAYAHAPAFNSLVLWPEAGLTMAACRSTNW